MKNITKGKNKIDLILNELMAQINAIEDKDNSKTYLKLTELYIKACEVKSKFAYTRKMPARKRSFSFAEEYDDSRI